MWIEVPAAHPQTLPAPKLKMLSISLGEHLHEDRNPSFHLGHPTEGKNDDDSRGIKNTLQLPSSMLWFARPARWSQTPEEHLLSAESHTSRQCGPLPAASPAKPCPSDPSRTVPEYLPVNHAAQAGNPPEGGTRVEGGKGA